MLLELLGKMLPTRGRTPKSYRLGSSSSIYWLSMAEGLVLSTADEQLRKGDILVSVRKGGNIRLYRVTETDKHKMEDGKAAWLGKTERVHITPDEEGYPKITSVRDIDG